jgi:hypothetical protein
MQEGKLELARSRTAGMAWLSFGPPIWTVGTFAAISSR